jgi:uncharacterized protein (TIGR03083 family)
MAEAWAQLDEEQWSSPSWCTGWTVKQTAGHILSAAEQTPPHFYLELAQAGFRFNTFTERAAQRLGALEPQELSERLEARTTTTNRPPAPVVTMLGEIVVHGEDMRRPLGLHHRVEPEALVAIADSYKRSNLLIGAKRRIGGLRLVATDVPWSTGDGPEVSGPLLSLILVMTGRAAASSELSGEGLPTLLARC